MLQKINHSLKLSCRSTGIRDDLVFLLDEELCNIQLCALHMEMRNTEQLLASIGLLAYRVDSLAEANAALKNYGPESFHGDRISVKKKSDQQSAITKQNIHVSSMSGKTFPKIMFSRDVFHRSQVKSFFFPFLICSHAVVFQVQQNRKSFNTLKKL